jgi:hypothetical protein
MVVAVAIVVVIITVVVDLGKCLEQKLIHRLNSMTILDTLAKLCKVTVSFIMSSRLSVCMEQLGSYWSDFHEK